VGKVFAAANRLPLKPIKPHVRLRYMDGTVGKLITHCTYQKHEIRGTNGIKRFEIKYLVADIPEGFVLGLKWLQYANPLINWITGGIAWRDMIPLAPARTDTSDTIIVARRARQRIIASDIAANETPEWVKKKHPRVLETKDVGLPPRRGHLDYKIEMTADYRPRIQTQRRHPPEHEKMFRALAAEEESAGRWVRYQGVEQAVNMLMAAKAGGELRPCIDYRETNRFMKNDGYPVPNMRDMITKISKSKVWTSLDLPKAYHHVRLADKATELLMSFHCAGVLYSPRVMQFGSKTAVSHYQRFIMTVLGELVGYGVEVYLDNIVIHAETQEEHDRILDAVLTKLEENDLTIQPKKCEWSKQEVQFCGFMVGINGIRLDPEKLRAIREWAPPDESLGVSMKKTKVREFVGFCNFYRDGMDHYSDIAAPLTALTSPTAPWKWDTPEQEAFENLKLLAISAPVRVALNLDLPIEAFTDASDVGLAAAIHHRFPDGKLRPVAFHSRKLNKAEKNYSVHDRELLAIVEMFRKFETWMQGSKHEIKVWSDHSALQHFMKSTKLKLRTAGWAETLGEYQFKIYHLPGRENKAADALSRQYAKEDERGDAPLLSASHFAN